MIILRRAICLGVLVLVSAQFQLDSLAQRPPAEGRKKATDPPVFTKKQSADGRKAYREYCASCHGAKLEGLDIAPALNGSRFDQTWRGKAADILSFHVHRMPPENVDAPVNLDDETYANILAYILQMNDLEPGDDALPSDATQLAGLLIPTIPGMDYDPVVPVTMTDAQKALLANLPSVTTEMLQNPAPENWMHWGRTYDGQSYSPLKGITKDNVKDLTASWRSPLLFGPSMPMPLVVEGVMFLHTFPDSVIAMDATNGDVLWRYKREGLDKSSKKMGLAIYEDNLFVSTSDMHLIALNAKTGDVVWDETIDTKLPGQYAAAIFTRSAPLVAGGVVIQGTMGFRTPRGAFIVAHDIETGKEKWRFNTVAAPDKPGGNTWNDIPANQRNGGSVWQQGTYDPETNLVYFGVAPTYDTKPLLEATKKPGHNNDAMYTNCTIALDAGSGELVWYYQHMQNDQWDMDWGFERQLVDLPDGKGGTIKAVMNVGKMVMLDALDAATGKYLFTVDTGLQNIVASVDPETGKKTYDQTKIPNPETGSDICPTPFGARSWPQTSYSPDTKYVYVPITESCMSITATNSNGWLLTTGIDFGEAEDAHLDDGMMGRMQAIDVATRKLAWNTDVDRPISTGVLSTAGGVVFAGDIDPSLKAFDDATGKLLWEAPLDDAPSSSVITYQVGETQYIAVVVGMTNNHVRDITGHYRRWSGTKGIPGDQGGASIWVFALK
ncbi:MAG: PQQ-binding-like beta-propeller repeat protein [Candidatus Hydrogenedentota bacterium]